MNSFARSLLLVGFLLSIGMSAVNAEERIDGVVGWAQRVDLTIPVEGVIKKVLVNTGQKVKKGQVLVELDKRVVRANLRQAKASSNGLKASYEETKRELERAIELYDRTVLSDHDLQVAKNNEVIAKSQFELAKYNLVKAQVEFEYASLRAPFDGLVLRRSVEVGKAMINTQVYDTLITLASSEKYLATAKLTSTQSATVSIGDKVSVLSNGSTYLGSIVAIEYVDVNVTLIVEFKSANKKLHAGLAVSIIL